MTVSRNVCSLAVCVVIAIVSAASSSNLPKGFIQCKYSDPKLDDCIMNGIQSGIPHLAKGVPSLGIVKIDPLRITRLEIDQGKGPVSINLKFQDLDITNLQFLVISKLQYDKMKRNLQFEVTNPKPLLLTGLYEISGKVLILPIVGNGKSKITLDISKIIGTVQMKPIVKRNVTYLDIEKLSWKITPSNAHIKLDNLFNGDKALGDNMNLFLNENWREVFSELQSAIEEAFGAAFKDIVRQFLKRVPLNQLFLE